MNIEQALNDLLNKAYDNMVDNSLCNNIKEELNDQMAIKSIKYLLNYYKTIDNVN